MSKGRRSRPDVRPLLEELRQAGVTPTPLNIAAAATDRGAASAEVKALVRALAREMARADAERAHAGGGT